VLYFKQLTAIEMMVRQKGPDCRIGAEEKFREEIKRRDVHPFCARNAGGVREKHITPVFMSCNALNRYKKACFTIPPKAEVFVFIENKEVRMKIFKVEKLQKKCLAVVQAVSVLILLPAGTLAAPSWRGDEKTTFEQWSFTQWNYGPLEPDADPMWNNNYGTPLLFVDSASQWSQSVDQYSGVWTLGGEMFLEIPNFPQVDGQKEIWIQLAWKAAGCTYQPDKPIIGIETDVGIDRMELFDREEVDGNAGWKLTTYKYHIWPNPTKEWITVSGDIYLDSVVVDTYCGVPEPCTLAVLALGAGLAAQLKRGNYKLNKR
jgi:hypothetical protein